MRPRDISKAVIEAAKGMRRKFPDLEYFTSVGSEDGSRLKIRKSTWPTGVTISVPVTENAHLIADGAGVLVGYENGRRNAPFIKRIIGLARGVAEMIGGSLPTIGQWLQSNFSPGQNAVGGEVARTKYLFDAATFAAEWPLPTSQTSGTYHTGLAAFGLARFQIGGSDYYAAAWPQKASSGDDYATRLGVWQAGNHAPVWEAPFGHGGPVSWVNPTPPLWQRFFKHQIGMWISAWEGQVNASSGNPKLFTAMSATVKHDQTFDKKFCNSSISAWLEGEEDKHWLCLPHARAGPMSGDKIAFYLMNTSTGEWAFSAGMSIENVPEGEAAAVPELIETGTGFGSPVAWREVYDAETETGTGTQEALVFVSGGERDVLDSTKWNFAHWTIRGIKPDGTAGSTLKSVTLDPTEYTLLSVANLKAEALAAPYPFVWQGSTLTPYAGDFAGGVRLGSSDDKSSFQHFNRITAIQLPVDHHNSNRLGQLALRLAVNGTDLQWPTSIKNHGGGIVVDDGGIAWSVQLEPRRILYGGTYTNEILENTTELWRWTFHEDGCAAVISTAGFSNVPFHPIAGITMTDGGGFDEFDDCPGSPVGTNDRYRSYGMYFIGMRDQKQAIFEQRPGWIWRTMLRGIRPDNSMISIDISQRLDALHTAFLGGGGSGAGGSGGSFVTVTEPDFETPDNVWAWCSFAEEGLVALLRDLRSDGANKVCSPAIEIWDVVSEAKLSTVRLGSYTETIAADNGPEGWLAGDVAWHPYAFGPPRMKACYKAGVEGPAVPVIIAMVAEAKKVDVDTESQFKRVCYATIELTNPASPSVTRSARTSPDMGVGSSGDVPGLGPIWDSWDTLVLTPSKVACIRDSEFREF